MDMKCAEVHGYLLDLAIGEGIPAGVQEHLRACQACTREVESFQKTMALLDEWKAPEDTSPYFMTRLRARVREEAQLDSAKSAGWMSWFRKPVLAAAFSLLILLSASLILGPDHSSNKPAQQAAGQQPRVSAVADLQYLDKNSDVLANFELLDDDAGDQSISQ
jgi:predicted anti-sigma-YlaC factor YlaD